MHAFENEEKSDACLKDDFEKFYINKKEEFLKIILLVNHIKLNQSCFYQKNCIHQACLRKKVA